MNHFVKYPSIFLIFNILIFSGSSVIAQDQYFDIVNVDLVGERVKKSESIEIYNIHLGMGLKKTRSILNNIIGARFLQDKFNNHRFYLVRDLEEFSDDNLLAYFVWEHQDSGLKKIVIYDKFNHFLFGRNKWLFNENVLKEGSSLMNNYLGGIKKVDVILDVPSINLSQTQYSFNKVDFKIIKKINEDKVGYSMVLTSKGFKEQP